MAHAPGVPLEPECGARPYGYEDAEKRYAPYDRLHDLDPATQEALAKVIVGITGRGQNAYVTISNHAEGCAPLTVQRLAQHVRALHTSASPGPSPGTATG